MTVARNLEILEIQSIVVYLTIAKDILTCNDLIEYSLSYPSTSFRSHAFYLQPYVTGTIG